MAEGFERDEHGWIRKVGEVDVEQVDDRAGWALFTGCAGDCPTFRALFVSRTDGERYIAMCNADVDSDDYMTDPMLVPAVVAEGHIIAANHYDDELSAGVLLRAADIGGVHAERMREEAAPRAIRRVAAARGKETP